MSKYISIKDFALKVGVSPQAIYQRLDKDLKQYSSIQNGKKVLSEQALQLFGFKDFKESFNQENSSNSSDLTIQALVKQLEIKDRQIETLTQALQTEQQLHIEARRQVQLLRAAQQPEPETAPKQEQESGKQAEGAAAEAVTEGQAAPENRRRSFRELWHDFWNG